MCKIDSVGKNFLAQHNDPTFSAVDAANWFDVVSPFEVSEKPDAKEDAACCSPRKSSASHADGKTEKDYYL